MVGVTETFQKSYRAEADIDPFLIVTPGTADGSVVQATAATDAPLGTLNFLGAENGKMCDVVKGGTAKCIYGGTVQRGDRLTSDANGKAIATTTAGNRVIGIAETDGVADDEGVYWVAPSQI